MSGRWTRRRFLTVLGGAGLLAGCAAVPTSGPVTQVRSSNTPRGRSGVDVAPRPPARDASPELILAGFLQATTNSDDGYRFAREYLAPAAVRNWDPQQGAVIYDATQNKPVATATSAGLRTPLIARLDAGGRYRPATGEVFDHDFGMVRVDGQWRISRPPEGLVLSIFTFTRSYETIPLYFPSRRSGYLVPDLIHLPQSSATPTTAITSLLSGPAPWLAGVVTSVVPTGTKLSVNAVPVDSRDVAEVSLTSEVIPLTDGQRRQLAGQAAWTLSAFPKVGRVRLASGGTNLSIPGSAEDDTVSTSLFTSMSPLMSSDVPTMYGLRSGRLLAVPDAGGQSTLRRTAGEAPQAIAVDRAGTRWAFVDSSGTRLGLWSKGVGEESRLLATGDRLLRPQIATDGSVWAVGARGTGSRIQAFDQAGRAFPVNAPDLAARRVRAFSLSPDMARMAMVVGNRLAIARLRPGSGAGQVVVDGLTEMSLQAMDPGLTLVIDVGWVTTESLLVLARSAADAPGAPFQLNFDGSGATTIGPLSSSDLVQLATLPRSDGINALALTSDGQVLRYEDRYRWRRVLTDATAVAMSF